MKTEDYSEIDHNIYATKRERVKKERLVYCNSVSCTKHLKRTSSPRVLKDTKSDRCPDCRHFLQVVWRKVK